MPKASMNKYNFPQARKHNIGTARQVFSVQPKAETHPMNQHPNNLLRSGISSLDRSHDLAALFRGENVSQCFLECQACTC